MKSASPSSGSAESSPRLGEESWSWIYTSMVSMLKEIVKSDTHPKLGPLNIDPEFATALLQTAHYDKQEGVYLFRGLPGGNLIKQICKIMEIWASQAAFPVRFYPFPQFKQDRTHLEIEKLNKLSHLVISIENTATANQSKTWVFEKLENQILQFYQGLEMRGILTCLGIRSTIGSIDGLSPSRSKLFEMFNRRHIGILQVQQPEYEKKVQNMSVLTVGARALSKHAHRSTEGFWGTITGGEVLRNQKANEVCNRILDECVWINMHMLPHNTQIIEIRQSKGYGARWKVSGEFRGFVEPQMDDGHDKKWRH